MNQDNVLQEKTKIQTQTGKLTSSEVHPNEAPYIGNVWVHIECEVTSGEFQVSNKFTQVRCNTIAFSKSTNMMWREDQIVRIPAIAKISSAHCPLPPDRTCPLDLALA